MDADVYQLQWYSWTPPPTPSVPDNTKCVTNEYNRHPAERVPVFSSAVAADPSTLLFFAFFFPLPTSSASSARLLPTGANTEHPSGRQQMIEPESMNIYQQKGARLNRRLNRYRPKLVCIQLAYTHKQLKLTCRYQCW